MLFFHHLLTVFVTLIVFTIGFVAAVLWFDFSTKKAPPKSITPVKTEPKDEPTELPIIHKKIEVWKVGSETEILDSSYQMAWNLQK
jgi:hypothetical protein